MRSAGNLAPHPLLIMSDTPKPPPALRSFSHLYVTLFGFVKRLLTDPQYFSTLAWLVLLGETVLSEAIIRLVSCQALDTASAESFR